MDKWDLLNDILKFNPNCADCGSNKTIDLWVILNRGVICCEQCALIHAGLGKHISYVKCLTIPPSISFTTNLKMDKNMVNRFSWTHIELLLLKYYLAHAETFQSLWYSINNPGNSNNNNSFVKSESGQRNSCFADLSLAFKDQSVQIDLGSCSTLIRSNSSGTLSKPNSRINSVVSYNNRESTLTQISDLKSINMSETEFASNPLYFDDHGEKENVFPPNKLETAQRNDENINGHNYNKHYQISPNSTYEIKVNYIRTKYQFLSFVDKLYLTSITMPPEDTSSLQDVLDTKLRFAVTTSKLETTLQLLVLGANPNCEYYDLNEHLNIIIPSSAVSNGIKPLKRSNPLLEALKFGQFLQAHLLVLWGAVITPLVLQVIKQWLEQDNMDKSNMFITGYQDFFIQHLNCVTDTLYQYTYTMDFETKPINNDEKNEKQLDLFFKSLLNRKITSLGNLKILMQDMYDDVYRRELKYYFGVNNNNKMDSIQDDIPNSKLTFLPINPLLSPQRNEIRQKLSKLPSNLFKPLCKALLLRWLELRGKPFAKNLNKSHLYISHSSEFTLSTKPENGLIYNTDTLTHCNQNGLHNNFKRNSIPNFTEINSLKQRITHLENTVNNLTDKLSQTVIPIMRDVKLLSNEFSEFRQGIESHMFSMCQIMTVLSEKINGDDKKLSSQNFLINHETLISVTTPEAITNFVQFFSVRLKTIVKYYNILQDKMDKEPSIGHFTPSEVDKTSMNKDHASMSEEIQNIQAEYVHLLDEIKKFTHDYYKSLIMDSSILSSNVRMHFMDLWKNLVAYTTQLNSSIQKLPNPSYLRDSTNDEPSIKCEISEDIYDVCNESYYIIQNLAQTLIQIKSLFISPL